VSLFALASLSVLYGLLGLVLAAPLTVVIIVWVKTLYIGEEHEPAEGGPLSASGPGSR
jgi:predicted PurR-regulated permease PerM